MNANAPSLPRKLLIWAGLGIAVLGPLIIAAQSPLLAWREPIYIAAGFAGVVAMACLLLQPLLAAGRLPGLPVRRSRHAHMVIGVVLLGTVLAHVIGLWITSPPDVIDALLFRSPTPFSAWGVVAMWALFATAALAFFRRKLNPRLWRFAHTGLACIIVAGSVIHAVLIEGAMGTWSKAALCLLVVVATAKTIADLRIWRRKPRRS